MSIFSKASIEEKKETIKPLLDPRKEDPDADSFIEAGRFAETNVIDLVNINLSFGDKKIFDNLNLSFPDILEGPQVYSICGLSGCGKSTILRLLAGLQKADSGDIFLYGQKYTDSSTLPMIFQQHSNYPWKTVRENLELPLKMEGKLSKKEIDVKVDEMLKIIGLEDHAEKWAGNTLSGGQNQRLSIGRSIIRENQVLMLDEATSALDLVSKNEVHKILFDIIYNSNLDITILNVTHSPEEAALLSNRVIVLAPWPCRVHRIIEIDYGVSKRTEDIKTTSKYFDYVKEIQKALQETVV